MLRTNGSELIRRMSGLWNAVIDLIAHNHECCISCMPYDEGPVWLSSGDQPLVDPLASMVLAVCEVNDIKLPKTMRRAIEDQTRAGRTLLEDALQEQPIHCPNCGAGWYLDTEIGDEWIVMSGEDLSVATYLLTKAYWPYLTHYTKPSGGASAEAVLARIVDEERLRASSNMVAGGHSVVCFTEASPLEVEQLIKHTGAPIGERFRWSRERYGIALTRTAAVQLAARPVLHGEPALYEALPEEYKHLFVRWQRPGRGIASDWTFEREFRVAGDVDLHEVDANDVMIIVPDSATAFRWLARENIPRFPIVIFNEPFSREDPYARLTPRQEAMRREWIAARTQPHK